MYRFHCRTRFSNQPSAFQLFAVSNVMEHLICFAMPVRNVKKYNKKLPRQSKTFRSVDWKRESLESMQMLASTQRVKNKEERMMKRRGIQNKKQRAATAAYAPNTSVPDASGSDPLHLKLRVRIRKRVSPTNNAPNAKKQTKKWMLTPRDQRAQQAAAAKSLRVKRKEARLAQRRGIVIASCKKEETHTPTPTNFIDVNVKTPLSPVTMEEQTPAETTSTTIAPSIAPVPQPQQSIVPAPLTFSNNDQQPQFEMEDDSLAVVPLRYREFCANGDIQQVYMNTYQGKLAGSINACATISYLQAAHYVQDGGMLSNQTIEKVIDEEAGKIAPVLRAKQNILPGGFMAHDEVTQYLDETLASKLPGLEMPKIGDENCYQLNGNLHDGAGLDALVQEVSSVTVPTSFVLYYDGHMSTILASPGATQGHAPEMEFLDSMKYNGNGAIRCKIANKDALKVFLQMYARRHYPHDMEEIHALSRNQSTHYNHRGLFSAVKCSKSETHLTPVATAAAAAQTCGTKEQEAIDRDYAIALSLQQDEDDEEARQQQEQQLESDHAQAIRLQAFYNHTDPMGLSSLYKDHWHVPVSLQVR